MGSGRTGPSNALSKGVAGPHILTFTFSPPAQIPYLNYSDSLGTSQVPSGWEIFQYELMENGICLLLNSFWGQKWYAILQKRQRKVGPAGALAQLVGHSPCSCWPGFDPWFLPPTPTLPGVMPERPNKREIKEGIFQEALLFFFFEALLLKKNRNITSLLSCYPVRQPLSDTATMKMEKQSSDQNSLWTWAMVRIFPKWIRSAFHTPDVTTTG